MTRHVDRRRDEFIAAATTVFEKQGVAQTTICNITEHMNVARSLFYHYFQDKDDLVDAVIDRYVDDFIARVCFWISSETIECPRAKVTHIVMLIRAYLMETNPFKKCIGQEGDASLLYQFTSRCAKRLSEFYGRDYQPQAKHALDVNVRHPRESYYVLVVGVIGLLNQEPMVSDEVIVDLICDALHIPA